MAFAKIFRWPRRNLQHKIDKSEASKGPSGQDLHQCCNDIIRDFERAFTLPNGWATRDKEAVFRLQEAALGLKQWKNSIRWCATPDHKCFSESDNEKVVQMVLASLKKQNFGLSENIGQHMSDVEKLLHFIEQLYISEDEEEAKYHYRRHCLSKFDFYAVERRRKDISNA
jgi:hypothetical protein